MKIITFYMQYHIQQDFTKRQFPVYGQMAKNGRTQQISKICKPYFCTCLHLFLRITQPTLELYLCLLFSLKLLQREGSPLTAADFALFRILPWELVEKKSNRAKSTPVKVDTTGCNIFIKHLIVVNHLHYNLPHIKKTLLY